MKADNFNEAFDSDNEADDEEIDEDSHLHLPRRLVKFANSPKLKGIGYVFRSKARIIRSNRYSVDKEPELHYRELMMLYTPWKDEIDLKRNITGYTYIPPRPSY